MKKKLEKLNKYSTMIIAFLLAVGIGGLGREALIATNIIQPKQAVVEIKRDVMPLENGGEVIIAIVENEKRVYISYEDLEYIGKKKSKMKKLIKNLGALYERLAE